VTRKKNKKSDDDEKKHDWGIHPAPLAVPPVNAINPQDLGPAEKLAVDEEDVESFLDHFHQHTDKPDVDSEAPPP
jgi:hypothetical protein